MSQQLTQPGILFAAKSTVDAKGSIGTQLADGRKLAERESIEVVAEYSDEAASAYSGNRGSNLKRAMAECERLAPCTLIVQHSDRLARGDGKKAKHLLSYALWAIEHDVTIRSVQDPKTFDDLVYTAIEGHRNNEDSVRKAAAVKDGLRRRAERGGLAGGPRPYAYRWHAWIEDGKRLSELRVVPDEAKVVERIYLAATSGSSQLATAKALNHDGLTTSNGKPWRQCGVRKILCSPLYMGKIPHKGEVYPGTHEAIVSEETWQAAAEARSRAAATRNGRQRGGGRYPRGRHLLVRGLLRCSCGAPLAPRTDPRATGPASEVYQCLGRYADVDSCSQPPIARATIDEAILTEISTRYLDVEQTRERLRARRDADRELAETMLAEREAEAARVHERMQRVVRAFQDGKIEADDYAGQRAGLIDEQRATEAAVELARANTKRVSYLGADVEVDVLRKLSELRAAVLGPIESAKDLNATRRLLGDLFREVRYLDGKLYLSVHNPDEPELIEEHLAGVGDYTPRRRVALPEIGKDSLSPSVAEQTIDSIGLVR
jgi:site-specific DNA recombinase